MFKKILVGLDGSAGSLRAMEAAAAIAQKFGSTITTMSVIELAARFGATVGEVDDAEEAAERTVEDAQSRAREIAAARDVPIEMMVVHGHPAQRLAERAREGRFDLAVVGHSGVSDVWGTFLGTTSDKFTRHATCSVLIVR
jgi:nucleotide-binding universal stress UspA family protein